MPCENLTRFYSTRALPEIREVLSGTFERMVVPFKLYPSGLHYQFQTVDKRMCPINGEVNLQVVGDGNVLVVFGRGKGDPIEFTRFYRAVSGQCTQIIKE
jgi:serine/threonine-protein kinase Chk1